MKKKIIDWIKSAKEMLIAITAISAILGGVWTFVWGSWIGPRVDCRIDEKMRPAIEDIREIQELVAYMTFITEATADPEKVAIAEKQYMAWKKRLERLDK